MKKKVMYSALILYFLSGTVYVMSGYNHYQLPMLLISVVLICVTHLFSVRYVVLHSSIIDFSYLMFSLSIMISGLVNNQMSAIISGCGILALWFVFSVLLPMDKIFKTKYLKNINFIILVPYILLMLYSYCSYPIKFIRYAGIFRSSSGFGDAAATACAVILAKMIYDFTENNTKVCKRIDIAILIFVILNCLISTCRGAIITALLLIVISLFVIIKKTRKNYKLFINVLVGAMLLLLVGYVLYKATAIGTIVDNILVKFQAKSSNILGGREEIWATIFERAKLFGNGEDIDVAAHNSFISILDQYGYFSFFFLVIFVASTLVASFRIVYSKAYNSKEKYLPLTSCLGFMFMSMTEGMMLKTIMLMVVFCFPLYHRTVHLKRNGEYENESNVDWN